MLRDAWNRIFRRTQSATIEREAKRKQMSPAEREFADKGIGDLQADEFVREHVGGIKSEGLGEGEPEPPPS